MILRGIATNSNEYGFCIQSLLYSEVIRRMKQCLSTAMLVAAALICPSLTAQLYPPDVQGLQTGMPVAAARAKLNGFKVVTIAQKDSAQLALVGYTDTEAWVFVAVNDKLAYIQHQVYYPDVATAPLYKETFERFKQKYGGAGNHDIVDFDATGKIKHPPRDAPRSPCSNAFIADLGSPLIGVTHLIKELPPYKNPNYYPLANMYLPTRFSSVCAESISGQVEPDVAAGSGERVVRETKMTLIDQRPLFEEAQRFAKSQAGPPPDDSKRAKPPI